MLKRIGFVPGRVEAVVHSSQWLVEPSGETMLFSRWFAMRRRGAHLEPRRERLSRWPSGGRRSGARSIAAEAFYESLERRELLTVTFHGSTFSEPDLIPHIKVQAVYFGSGWQQAPYFNQTGQIEGFLQYLPQSPYMDLLAQLGYRVGRGSFDTGIIDQTVLSTSQYVFATPVAGEVQNSVTEELQSLISHGDVKSPDLDRVYIVYVQPNVAINDGFGHSSERSKPRDQEVLGFHSYFNGTDQAGNPATIRYAVISYPGGTYNLTSASQGLASDFDWLTSIASHELAETVTDPGNGTGFTGWYDGVTTNEIADLALGQYAHLNSYLVDQLADMQGVAQIPDGTPKVSLPAEGAFSYLQNGSAVTIAPGAALNSTGSSGLNGGTLAVSLTANPDSRDVLQINNQGTGAGQIGVAGGIVSYGGSAIGSFSGGSSGVPLRVTFNSSATAAAAQQCMRQITFQSPGPNPATATRTISFQVTNSDGNTSAAVAAQVNVVSLKSSASEARLYRAYNPQADLHVFTTSLGEFNYQITHGLRDESTGQSAFAVLADYVAGTTAMHRLYNPNSGEHYYTLSDGERDALVQAGWNFEKEEGYMFPVSASPPAGTAEIFRLYNTTPSHGEHLFTQDASYKNAVLFQFPGVWVVNSSLGFAFAQDASAANVGAMEMSLQPAIAARELLDPPVAIAVATSAGMQNREPISGSSPSSDGTRGNAPLAGNRSAQGAAILNPTGTGALQEFWSGIGRSVVPGTGWE